MPGVTHQGIIENNRELLLKTPVLYSTALDPRVRKTTALNFHQAYAAADEKAARRGIPSGGVRPLDIIQRLPRNESPVEPFFKLVDTFIFSTLLGAAGGAGASGAEAGASSGGFMDLFDLGMTATEESYNAYEAVDAYNAYLSTEDAVSVLDNVAEGGSGYVDWSAVENNVSVSEGAGTSWMQRGIDWATDLGKRATEQYVKSAIADRFAPAPGVRQGATVPTYRNLPQSNVAPRGGIGSFIYGGGSSGPGGYSGGSISPASRGGSSEGGMNFSSMFGVGAIALFVLVLVFVFIRR